MKTKILIGSVCSAALATVIGVTGVLTSGESLEALVTTAKAYQIASMFGLLSVATFFVGLVYPANSKHNNSKAA